MVDEERRKVLRLLATAPLLSGAAASLLSACGKDKQDAPGAAPGASPENEGTSAEAPASESLPWAGRVPSYNVAECLAFASLVRGGLFIDFGTTDCFKYVLGRWRSGWGQNLSRDGVAYTHATTTTSRINFHWDKSEALVARFRIQRVASKFFSLYLNGKPVQKVDIDRVDWTTYESAIPAEFVRPGVNQMLLRWEKTEPAMGEDVAAAVDYVQVSPAQAQAPAELPRQASLLTKLGDAGDQGEALVLAAGTGLQYWLQIPDEESPMLGLHATVVPDKGATAAPKLKLSVRATQDGAAARELFSGEVPASGQSPIGVDLADLREKVVRLDIEVSALEPTQARLALLEPTLYTKRSTAGQAKPKKAAQNVIVVMIDTLRADHVKTYSADTEVKAPVLEKLAKESAVFDRFSAVEDWTKPSCATMLTGLYPVSHKTQTDAAKLPGSVRMVTEELKQHGISTGGFIANGYVSDKFGFGRGWDHYRNYIRETKPTEAEHVFADAYAWIAQRKEGNQRFYTYIQTIDPHVPYDPPKEFLDLYEEESLPGDVKPRSTANLLEDIKKGKFTASARDKERIHDLYKGEISYHDKWFGDFLEKLDTLGLLEETLIVVLSDHGEEFWEHGSVGHGHQLHQELIHVPYVMHWKGTIPAGVRVRENHDHIVLVPTIFDAMGLPAPDYLEGPSVLAQAMGAQSHAPHAGFSTHQGDREAVWSGRWKVLHRGPSSTYLFDVDSDPQCQKNLEESHAVTLCYMRALLGQFQGADNKLRWRSRELEKAVASRVKEEKIEIDDTLNDQLKELGYFR